MPTDESGKLVRAKVSFQETWQAMEKLVDQKLTLAIGISNTNNQTLVDVLSYARIKPAVNQVELHPYLPQDDLISFHKANDVQMTAYSPFGSGKAGILDDETVAKIAAKHKKSPANVLVRYHLDRQVIVIPKSVTASRIVDNFNVFDFKLDEEDLKALEGLNKHTRVVDTRLFLKFDIYA